MALHCRVNIINHNCPTLHTHAQKKSFSLDPHLPGDLLLNSRWQILAKMRGVCTPERNLQNVTYSDCPWQHHAVAPILTATLPTCLVPKTTRGVWLLGLSATTLMGANTIRADRNMRGEEGDFNVICLETSSSQNKPQCSPGVLWQPAPF